jgi:hypothetical protein
MTSRLEFYFPVVVHYGGKMGIRITNGNFGSPTYANATVGRLLVQRTPVESLPRPFVFAQGGAGMTFVWNVI